MRAEIGRFKGKGLAKASLMPFVLVFAVACQPPTLPPETWNDGSTGSEAETVGQDVAGVDAASKKDMGAGLDTAAPVDAGGCQTVGDCGPNSLQCAEYACQVGKCVLVKLSDGTSCVSSGLCDESAVCSAGVCVATKKSCEDSNDCTADSCDPKTGQCVNAPVSNGSLCDDGELCTQGDACDSGVCVAGTNTCACMSATDCASMNPIDDLCAKTYYCDKTVPGKYKCALNPASGVSCPVSQSECFDYACAPKTGKCEKKPKNEGKLCDKGNSCTQSDCESGECVVEAVLCECLKSADCLKLESYKDYDPCEGIPYCDKSVPGNWSCKLNLATKVKCDSGKDTVCQKNMCLKISDSSGTTLGAKCQLVDTRKLSWKCKPDVPYTKCHPVKASEMCPETPQFCDRVYDPNPPKLQTVLCDDGNACTVNDVCLDGACMSGSTNICPCQQDADCKQMDDGNKCNGVMWCNKLNGKCEINPATIVSCSTVGDTACVRNFCLPEQGKCKMIPTEHLESVCMSKTGTCDCEKKPEECKIMYVPNKKLTVSCEDGNPCTMNDLCSGGKCVTGKTNVCLCKNDAECQAKDDGDLCNGKLYCDLVSGECKPNPATVVTCSTVNNTFCRINFCDPKTGQCKLTPREDIHEKCDPKTKACHYSLATDGAPSNLSVFCDDGNECTVNDVCKEGLCVAGGTNICPCQKDGDCLKMEDGDSCNGTLYCDISKSPHECKVNPATVVTCPSVQDTDCQANLCDKKTGKCKLTPVNTNLTCDADGNACTSGDICVAGKCVAGTNICPCEKDADCESWDDGNKCNGTMYCDKTEKIHQCKVNPVSVVTCQTVNDTVCSKNLCDPKTGSCVITSSPDSKHCDDGDACTVNDLCTAGKCVGGVNICVCKGDADCLDDGDKCNGLPVCLNNTCKVNAATVVSCGGGKACVSKQCEKLTGKCEDIGDDNQCDDGNPCTADSCDVLKAACKHQSIIDGAACGGGSAPNSKVCLAGACKEALVDARLVPPITFFMGCNATLDSACKAKPEEAPQHKVSLTKAFFVQTHEVTVAEYEACVAAKDCTPQGTGKGCKGGNSDADLPINCVTWEQANTYCKAKKLRLPTEAEWEGAGRGDCGKYAGSKCEEAMPTWPWGEVTPTCEYTLMQEVVGKPGCGAPGGLLPGGSKVKDKSLYGVMDMGGSLSEWVADIYDEKYYQKFSNGVVAKDPKGPVGNGDQRVVRGGNNLSSDGADLRLSRRAGKSKITSDAGVGFRCVKDIK